MAATDWSEVFEKRLTTVLSEGQEPDTKGGEKKSRLMAELDLTPPPTAHKRDQPPPPVQDPAAAFFDSIRKPPLTSLDSSGKSALRGGASPNEGPVTLKAQPRPQDGSQPGIKELQQSYSNRARDLHRGAMERLNEVEGALEKQLTSMEQEENAFLATLASKQAMYSRPPAEWTVKIQTRAATAIDDKGKEKERPVEREERIVDRVANMRAAAATLEDELGRLWKEWDQAQTEVTAALEALFGDDKGTITARKGDTGANSCDAILQDAEKELDAAAAEAMRDMKENEKSFRKLILAEECKLAQSMLARQSKYD